MPMTDVVEGAVTAGVNRALHTAADAAHHVVATPANMVVESAKTATVFIATHVIVGGLKLSCTAAWWVITTTAAAVGTVIGVGASAAYNHFFAPKPKMITWHNSYDIINLPSSKSTDDSARLLEDGAATPRSPRARPSVADID